MRKFLIIAYRELRLLEIDVMREIRESTGASGQEALDVEWLSVVNVDQFYGIELGKFSARIAETALWMMDYLMNNWLSLEFGRTYTRIPSGGLEVANAIHGQPLGVIECSLDCRSSVSAVAALPPVPATVVMVSVASVDDCALTARPSTISVLWTAEGKGEGLEADSLPVRDRSRNRRLESCFVQTQVGFAFMERFVLFRDVPGRQSRRVSRRRVSTGVQEQ